MLGALVPFVPGLQSYVLHMLLKISHDLFIERKQTMSKFWYFLYDTLAKGKMHTTPYISGWKCYFRTLNSSL